MTPRRVLVVDDEPALRNALGRLLEMSGYDTLKAGNGEEALEVLMERGVDIILVDLQMPGMSGQTLFHAIRSRWPALADAIIVMSGDPDAPEIVEWLTLHGVPVLAKPFGREALLRAIEVRAIPRLRRANGEE